MRHGSPSPLSLRVALALLAAGCQFPQQAPPDPQPTTVERTFEQHRQDFNVEPNRFETNLALAEGYLARSELDAAEAHARRAVKLAQALNNVYLMQQAKTVLSRVFFAQSRFDLVSWLYRDGVVNADGTHWGCAYQGLGELYSALGQPARPPGEQGRASDARPDDADLALAAALEAHAAGDNAAALRYIERSLALQPREPLRVLKGFFLLFARRYKEAETLFRDAASARTEDPGPWVGLAHLAIIGKQDPGRVESATAPRVDLSQAPGPDPYARFVHRMAGLAAGWALANRNEHDKAALRFEAVLGHHPGDILARLGQANSLIVLRRLDRAEVILQGVLADEPGNPYALAELAGIRYERGQDEAAEQGFRAALQRDRERYTCPYEGLGLLYLRQGKIAAAKQNLQKAIAINPDIEYKKFNALARIYIEEGRLDEARRLLQKSVENFPHDDEARSLLLELRDQGAGR